jgi:DNA-binding transcriptional LysR family regulator
VVRGRVTTALADGRLVSLLEDWLPPPTDFLLYYPSRRQVPPPLRAFIDFVRETFDGARPANGAKRRPRKR